MIDYSITALSVLYWAMMAVWAWFLFTTDLATKNNTWIMLAIFALMIPYHLFRHKRKKLQAEKPV